MRQPEKLGEQLLKQTPYGVTVEGVDVVMQVGTATCRMDYTTAIKLGTFLYHGGKMAKRNAGDASRGVIGIATLTDASADELEAQFSRDRTAVFAKV